MHEVQPKAELICHDLIEKVDNLQKIYAGYRRCYSAKEFAETGEGKKEEFIRKMMRSGHESPLEHASLTFHLTCSRACSHQLVRHRIASYSQQSQRYVRMDDLPVIVPPKVQQNTRFMRLFKGAVYDVEQSYAAMLRDELPAEDARYLLPNCVATQIVVTMNVRTLLHFFAERCCSRAQWEIRDIAGQMLEICKELYPCVFEHAGPKCKRLGRCPEHKPCGARPWAV